MRVLTASSVLLILALVVQSEEESGVPEQGEEVPEVLPTPLEYRGGSRKPVYDDHDIYDSLSAIKKYPLRRPSSNIAQEFTESKYGNSKYDQDTFAKSETDYGGIASSSSEYGSYADESGYGYSCDSNYVNSSAVALLAFLFLLNLVQDIIQQVTAENARRRRDAEEESDALQFIRDGGLDALREGLPDIVIPLMVKLSDSNRTECITRPLCDANAKLSDKYGPVGRVFATLLSNIASHAFSNKNAISFDLAQAAAYHGRNEQSCHMFDYCAREHSKTSNTKDNKDNNVI